ncbi:Modification methylase NgoFVII [Frankliniella fusca]|uniref:Modification methylase NgoFVII n=1 Tax=Frankliniella fusca TaxID=407009 RepID=A0AAE1H9I6_9NEOP|nr:Modification methylase NgoFVII [Frankliniella fusca]
MVAIGVHLPLLYWFSHAYVAAINTPNRTGIAMCIFKFSRYHFFLLIRWPLDEAVSNFPQNSNHSTVLVVDRSSRTIELLAS